MATDNHCGIPCFTVVIHRDRRHLRAQFLESLEVRKDY